MKDLGQAVSEADMVGALQDRGINLYLWAMWFCVVLWSGGGWNQVGASFHWGDTEGNFFTIWL